MAVVKSPKNNKRKVLWMSKFKKNKKAETLSIKKVKTHSKIKTNSFSQLWHRKRSELTVRNVIPFLTHS